MDQFTLILTILSILILGFGLVYTYQLGSQHHKMRQKYDTEISEKVQKHPYIRNPIFLVYMISSLLVIAYIVYIALYSS